MYFLGAPHGTVYVGKQLIEAELNYLDILNKANETKFHFEAKDHYVAYWYNLGHLWRAGAEKIIKDFFFPVEVTQEHLLKDPAPGLNGAINFHFKSKHYLRDSKIFQYLNRKYEIVKNVPIEEITDIGQIDEEIKVAKVTPTIPDQNEEDGYEAECLVLN